jgi:predicted dehydrogenase
MNVGILGSGFGLYGYMPAFVELGYSVITLAKYKGQLSKRSELGNYLNFVNFVDTEDVLLRSSKMLAIARNPASQSDFLLRSDYQYSHLFLEKPLAENATRQELCLNRLVSRNQSFSVAYLFRFCDWWMYLRRILSSSPGTDAKIVWSIPASTSSWKNSNEAGGGLGSFYGIHFLPLILDLGMAYKVRSAESSIRLSAVSNLDATQKLEVNIVRDHIPYFSVSTTTGTKKEELFSAESPFTLIGRFGAPDPRIPFLKDYISAVLKLHIPEREQLIEKEAIRFRECLSHG